MKPLIFYMDLIKQHGQVARELVGAARGTGSPASRRAERGPGVSRWQSSPRFRRRALWTLALAAVAGRRSRRRRLGDGEHRRTSPSSASSTGRRRSRRAPRIATALSPADDRAAARDRRRASSRTAVARRHLREAYDLVGPELRGGLDARASGRAATTRSCRSPRSAIAHWTVAYSYRERRRARPRARREAAARTRSARRSGSSCARGRADGPWRVVAWMPNGGLAAPATCARSPPARPSAAERRRRRRSAPGGCSFPVSLLVARAARCRPRSGSAPGASARGRADATAPRAAPR